MAGIHIIQKAVGGGHNHILEKAARGFKYKRKYMGPGGTWRYEYEHPKTGEKRVMSVPGSEEERAGGISSEAQSKAVGSKLINEAREGAKNAINAFQSEVKRLKERGATDAQMEKIETQYSDTAWRNQKAAIVKLKEAFNAGKLDRLHYHEAFGASETAWKRAREITERTVNEAKSGTKKSMEVGMNKSFEQLAAEAGMALSPEHLAKAVGGSTTHKYYKKVPKAGGGYNYFYHSAKHRYTHQLEKRAKSYQDEAKRLEKKGKTKEAEVARTKSKRFSEAAKKEAAEIKSPKKQYGAPPGRTPAEESERGARKQAAEKSMEQVAAEMGMSLSPEYLAKAVIEEPYSGKTRKKTVSDAWLMKYFYAYLRTQIRNKAQWNEDLSAQSVYDTVMTAADHNRHIMAALELMEKKKILFCIEMVEEAKKQVLVSVTDEPSPAPTSTPTAHQKASGGG